MEDSTIKSKMTSYTDIIEYTADGSNIKAYVIDRGVIKDKEYTSLGIKGHSIYFLYGEDEDDNLKVYVGRSSDTVKTIPAFTRLYQHKISNTEYYRDIWRKAIVISFDELSFDKMRYLENYFFKAILPQIRLNDKEPDTSSYQYNQIKRMVEQIKDYIEHILRVEIFIDDKKKPEKDTKLRFEYTDNEIRNQGKRIVDKDFEKVTEVTTPFIIAEKMLGMIPKSLWNPNTKILDLSCTSGEYLKVAFNKLIKSTLYDDKSHSNPINKTLHITRNQLYGIALTDESLRLSQNNLQMDSHIIKIDNFTEILRNFVIINSETNKLGKAGINQGKVLANIDIARYSLNKLGVTKNSLLEYLQHRFGDKELKFDIIIGNPPYQQGSKSIYNDFIDAAIDLNPQYITMIVKNNWLKSDTLKSTRQNMLNTGLKEIINYPNNKDVFSNVSVTVSIFNIEKNYEGETHYSEYVKDNGEFVLQSEYRMNLKNSEVIASSKVEQSLINRFSNYSKNENNFGAFTYPAEPFGINTNGTTGRNDNIRELLDFNEKSDKNNITVIYMESDKKPYYRYTNINQIPRRQELVPLYKVVCGSKISRNDSVITNINTTQTNTVLTGSWGILYATNSDEEKLNVKKYVQTKFFRCLVRCLTSDGLLGVSPYRFSLIPQQDFTSNSDIDWKQSLTDIDQKLYKKYNLTPEEINYIESTIKSLDTEPKLTEEKVSFTMHDVAANFINQQLQNQDTP